MKKIVPDPPAKIITSPYFSIHSAMPSQDALVYASQLLQGIEDTLDEYCCANAGEPGLGMLVNVAHTARMGRALVEHSLAREGVN